MQRPKPGCSRSIRRTRSSPVSKNKNIRKFMDMFKRKRDTGAKGDPGAETYNPTMID